MDKAIIQEGRKIVVDTQLVFELLQKTNNDRRSR
ncbi:DUF3853 family protein [Bacteroides caccae]